jgi:hypothetical protein
MCAWWVGLLVCGRQGCKRLTKPHSMQEARQVWCTGRLQEPHAGDAGWLWGYVTVVQHYSAVPQTQCAISPWHVFLAVSLCSV